MMIVRASRDLEPGTEITFWYHSPVGTSMKDLKGKLKHWEFVCDCTICQDAKATKSAVITKRQNLLESVRRAFNSSALHRNQIGGVERLLDTLNSTYMRPADEVPRLLLWDPQLALAKAHAAQNNMVKSLELVGKVLTSLGFMVVGTDSSSTSFAVIKWGLVIDHLVDVFLLAQTAFAAMKAGKDSIQAGEYARIAYRIIVGEDTSFGVTYG
jgi:hypothetical protein